MLTVHSLSKSYGMETILSSISFTLNSGERLGLVGPNGCGKTTLLRILAGQETPDAGGFHFGAPGLRLGYLPQGLAPALEETIETFLGRTAGSLALLTAELERLALALAQNPQQSTVQRAYDETLACIDAAAQSAGRMPSVLAALGLDHFSLDTPAAYLSGGQKTRLALSSVLLTAPQVLLLDEPTNHLDIDMLTWLEDWLVNSPECRQAAVLIVSHDRAFLDNTVSGILELDPLTHGLRAYAGNYSEYLEQKLAERERQWQAYSDQQEEIARLQRAAASVRDTARFRRGGKADTGDKFAKGFFANRGKERIALAKNIERRLEHLLTEEHIDKPRQSWQLKLEFGDTPASGRDVLVLEDLSVGYEGLTLLSGLNLHVGHGQRVGLIGPNGAGKTTLLRTIAGSLPPRTGRVRLGSGVRIGYMAQEQETLDPQQDALTTIRHMAPLSETDARTFLHQFLFSGDDVFTPLGSLSYGERARLLLACLVAQGCNLLLLDEPINHLDIPSRARFEQALANFEGTVLAVVHDRYFLEGFATTLWEARHGDVQVQQLVLA